MKAHEQNSYIAGKPQDLFYLVSLIKLSLRVKVTIILNDKIIKY